MGREFGFDEVRRTALALSRFLLERSEKSRPTVALNYDLSFLCDRLAREAARVLTGQGISVLFPVKNATEAAFSLVLAEIGITAGISLSAAGAKPGSRKMRLFNEKGAPVLPSWVLLIENEVRRLPADLDIKPSYPVRELIDDQDYFPAYRSFLEKLVDFNRLRSSGLRTVVLPGSTGNREYLDKILQENGLESVVLPGSAEYAAGGCQYRPSPAELGKLAGCIREKRAELGIALGGDGRGFWLLDAAGRRLSVSFLQAALAEYLIASGKMAGPLVKTVDSTMLLDRVAVSTGQKLYEAPCGENYLADMLSSRHAALAFSENSASIMGAGIYCADGLLFSLLAHEMIADYAKSPAQILRSAAGRFGPSYSRKAVVNAGNRGVELFRQMTEKHELPFIPGDPKLNWLDGLKAVFADGWFIVRPTSRSGYFQVRSEALTAKKAGILLNLGRNLLG